MYNLRHPLPMMSPSEYNGSSPIATMVAKSRVSLHRRPQPDMYVVTHTRKSSQDRPLRTEMVILWSSQVATTTDCVLVGGAWL